MINDLLRQYLDLDYRTWVMPLAVKVITPYDYQLYLYQGEHNQWFVIAEADYLLVKDIPRDIGAAFQYKVKGWRCLTGRSAKDELLKPDVFTSNAVEEDDEDWKNYHDVVFQKDGLKYALLEVEPS